MELWHIKREYRRAASAMRRRAVNPDIMGAELHVLALLATCDRTDTELSVLRLAKRCVRARLRRQRDLFENAVLVKSVPRLLKSTDEWAAEELEQLLTQHQHPHAAFQFRQVLDEMHLIEERQQELKQRLERLTTSAAEALARLNGLLKGLPQSSFGTAPTSECALG
jgi:hypothetical protein